MFDSAMHSNARRARTKVSLLAANLLPTSLLTISFGFILSTSSLSPMASPTSHTPWHAIHFLLSLNSMSPSLGYGLLKPLFSVPYSQ